MSDTQHISDDSDLRKYRIELPNIIDDLGLTPYEGRLYVHYKRVCGANGGTCTEGTRRTAQRTEMSTSQVSRSRDGLVSRGLIKKVESGQYMHVRIVDVWELNFAYFLIEDRPDIHGWTIEQLKDFLKSVPTRNTLTEKRPSEKHFDQKRPYQKRSVPTRNTLTEKRPCGTDKEETINKNQLNKKEQKRESPPAIPSFKIFTEITGYFAITKHWQNEMARIVGCESDDLEFWSKVVVGWTGKYSTKHNIKGMLEYYERREIPGYNGNGETHGHNQTPTQRGQAKRTQPPGDPAEPPAGVDPATWAKLRPKA